MKLKEQKLRHSSRKAFDKSSNQLNFGFLLVQCPMSNAKSYTLWTDRIDFIEADHRTTTIYYRTSSHPEASKHHVSLSINFDAFMHAYLIAEQKRICVDVRPICNLPSNDRLSDYNGNKKISDPALKTLLKMIKITALRLNKSIKPSGPK
jgi:hypothetical protein